MDTPISPLDLREEIKRSSPNGSSTAIFKYVTEVRMGGPTLGNLHLSDGTTFERCSPSMVWSEDSKYLAIPQWHLGSLQRVMIILINCGKAVYVPGTYPILELHSFSKGIIEGITTPWHMPEAVRIDAKAVLSEYEDGNC